MMRRSEKEILDTVYRRSSQIRLRRHILQAFAGVVAAAFVLTATPTLVRQLSVQQLNTADQPKTEEASGDETGKGGIQTAERGPQGSDTRSPTPRTTSGTRGSSSTKGSGSAGSLPAGTISQDLEIAFNRGSDIYLMNADGTGPRKLISGSAPGWSPDAKRVAFSDNNDYTGGDLQSINVDGSDVQGLRSRGSFPTWSPGGERLAFNWPCDENAGRPCSSEQPELACGPECGIGIVARDGTGVRRLGTGLWADWGSNGRIIFTDGIADEPCEYRSTFGAFAGSAHVEQPECALPIWVMNPDGSGRTRLPVDRAIMPTWSPDGLRIAYHTSTGGVFIAKADGTGVAQVAPKDSMHPSWSPDGLWLAFTRPTAKGYWDWQIYVRAIDGSNEKQLTSGPGGGALPAFSPQR